jgi:soluble lytic murein transglycosylase-like protein
MVAVLCIAASACAHAMQRVTLRNGFSYDCVRQQPIDTGRVRLFITGDGANFIDIPATEIAAVDTIPDPPAPPPKPVSPTTAVPSADIPTMLLHASAQHNIDVALLASVIHAESDFNPHAVSRAGAQGLMQLMPSTASQLGVGDAFRADQNIAGGTAYLDALLTRYHDNLALALAAYNAGPAAVDKYHGIPPYRETRAYVARVMREFKRRREAMDRASNLTMASNR